MKAIYRSLPLLIYKKFIVGLNADFGNNHIFLDEQDGIQYFDDTMRWYAYGNYNISPRYPYITYGPYVKNEHTDFFRSRLLRYDV